MSITQLLYVLSLCFTITSMKLEQQYQINTIKENRTDFSSFTWKQLIPKNKGPLPRRGHSMLQIDNFMIIFGGCYMETDCYNDVFFYDMQNDKWFEINATGQIPSPRQGHSASLYGTTMYIYGGSSGEGYLSELFSFDIEQKHWTQLAFIGKISIGRSGHGAAIDNDGRMIIFGGYTDKGYSNDLFIINLVTQRYEKPLTNGIPPTPRENFAFELINNRIIIFGGFQEGGVLNDLYTIGLIQWTWEKLSPNGVTPPAMTGMSSTHIGKKLYLSGGCDYHSQRCHSDTFVLDTESLWWSKLDPLNEIDYEARGEFSLAFYRGHIVLFGGCEMYRKCFDNMYKMDINMPCPGKCSNNGVCKEDTGCICREGFFGGDCSKKIKCVNECNMHGECKMNGKCLCYPGWAGLECNIDLACPRNCTDAIHGHCKGDNTCECLKGYYGSDCSEKYARNPEDDDDSDMVGKGNGIVMTNFIATKTELIEHINNKHKALGKNNDQALIEETFLYQLIKGDYYKNGIIYFSFGLLLCAVLLFLFAVFCIDGKSKSSLYSLKKDFKSSEESIINPNISQSKLIA